MKFLLFSDLHCHQSACQNIVDLAHQADILIGAGDLGHLRHGLDKTISYLQQITTPTILVPGNNESFEELQDAGQAWPAATVIHGSHTTLLGHTFFGLGGGIPRTPFGSWSYDFDENEAQAMLDTCPPNAIIISHSPPKGVVDVASSGQNLGSTTLRQYILDHQPPLVVCGHIHESGGQTGYLGDTPVVNAGSQGILWPFTS
ncbi:MAG TPA: metallophosphoesterase [Anaerolineae bacterium]|nr:metallophosphoesterase [Anaerolineae bacterium]